MPASHLVSLPVESLTEPNTEEEVQVWDKSDNQQVMETIGEIIPFAKEMLNQRPGRSMLKIYMLGSTLAVLGAVGGLVETVLLPFVEQETVEDTAAEQIVMQKKQLVMKSRTSQVHSEVLDGLEPPVIEVKAKHVVTAGQRSSANRLHAS